MRETPSLLQAKQLYEQNRFNDVVEWLHELLADKNLTQDSRKECHELLLKTLRILNDRPGLRNASLNFAEYLNSIGQFAEAIPHFEKSLKLQPKIPGRSLFGLSKALVEEGRVDEALKMASTLMAHFQNKGHAWRGISLAAEISRIVGDAPLWSQSIYHLALIGDSDSLEKKAMPVVSSFVLDGRALPITATQVSEAIRLLGRIPGPIMRKLHMASLVKMRESTRSDASSKRIEKEFLKLAFDHTVLFSDDIEAQCLILQFCIVANRKRLGIILIDALTSTPNSTAREARKVLRKRETLLAQVRHLEWERDIPETESGEIDLAEDLFGTPGSAPEKKKSKRKEAKAPTPIPPQTLAVLQESLTEEATPEEIRFASLFDVISAGMGRTECMDLLMAMILMRMYRAAEHALDSIEFRFPPHTIPITERVNLAYLRVEVGLISGRHASALAAVERALAFLPLEIEERKCFAYLHGECLAALGRVKEAQKVYKFVEQLDPKYRLVRRRLKELEQA